MQTLPIYFSGLSHLLPGELQCRQYTFLPLYHPCLHHSPHRTSVRISFLKHQFDSVALLLLVSSSFVFAIHYLIPSAFFPASFFISNYHSDRLLCCLGNFSLISSSDSFSLFNTSLLIHLCEDGDTYCLPHAQPWAL